MKRALYPGESPEVEETGRKEGTTSAASPPLRQLSTFSSFSNVATAHTNSEQFSSLFLRAYTWETWLPIVTARGGRGPPKNRLENKQGRNAQFLRPTSIFPEKREGESTRRRKRNNRPYQTGGLLQKSSNFIGHFLPFPLFRFSHSVS